MRRVTVPLEPPYDVVVGPGAIGELERMVGSRRQVVIVTEPSIAAAVAPSLDDVLDGPNVTLVLLDGGEPGKTLATVESLCRSFAAGGLLRGDAVVAVGGGVVGDTAGFAAAVYHRGVAVVQVPTTLLAQVDSAIGGKTAVNLPEGKNLVGAFHQPLGVLADTAVLVSLPERDFRSGLGEVAKYALMPEGDELVDVLRLHTDRVLARDPSVLADLVAACAAIKAGIVAADPYERSGARARLNYGHTLAHALEIASAELTGADGAIAHGEAVGIGLVFDANLANALERVGLDVVDRVHGVVASLGLPTAVPGDEIAADRLIDLMRRDKKASGGLTFVLPGADGLEQVDDPAPRALDAALRAVGVGVGVGG